MFESGADPCGEFMPVRHQAPDQQYIGPPVGAGRSCSFLAIARPTTEHMMAKAIPNTLAAIGAVALWSSVAPAFAEDRDEAQFGAVHFQTSCNDVAQRRFDRAMRYQHSFWYRESKQIFEEALAADPSCAIAYWGIALSLLFNPHIATPTPNLAPGLAALEKAKSLGAKTPREREYIDALFVLYTDYDKLTYAQRVQKYLKAMEALAQRYPDDDEAQITYAITLNVAASANDKSYANQLKGVALLELIFKRQPRHPGVAHYLIHLYDYPPIAEKGLDAARRYAEIAPSAPHAQHMPSHISPVSVTGRNPFHPIRPRHAPQRPARNGPTNCMPWTIWAM